MAEQHHRLPPAARRPKPHLQNIAEELLLVNLDAASDGLGEARYQAYSLIDCGLVVAGLLDEDQVAQSGCDPIRLRLYSFENGCRFFHGMFG
jgi:hypothetical protein